MRIITLISLFLLFSISAMEVGDQANCIKLNDLQVDRSIKNQCIETKNGEEKYILLEFMSVTCGPCIDSLPNLALLHEELEGFASVRMVNIDRNQTLVDEFLSNEEHNQYITMPFSFDSQREAARAYEIRFTPTLFILNNENKVVYKHIGLLFPEDLDEIRNLVKK